MQSCTECGTAISPAVGPPVLLNGKVVCQPCWQKVGATGAATPAAAARPSTQSSRLGASRRTSSAAPTPVRRQTSATPAARRSTSTRSESPPPPSRAGTARRLSSSGDEPPPPPRATSRTATLIEQVESSTSGERLKLYIIITMCVMVIVAGVVGYMWYSKKTGDERAAQQAELDAEAARAHVKGLVQSNPENYDAIIKAVDESQDKIKLFPAIKSELSTIRSDTVNKQQNAAARRDNLKLLEDLKANVEIPDKRATVKVQLETARRVANSMDKAYQEEVVKIADKLLLYTLKDGVDAAKAKEATGDLNAALAAYDEAVIKFNKEFDKAGGKSPTPEILALYKDLIADSDKLVERVETPEYEASIPERDLLSAKERQAAAWGKSAGIEMNWAPRELEIKGVDVEGKKIMGVASFGLIPAAPWHDLIIDLNFTIVSGGFQLYLRYWPDKRNFMLNIDPKAGYELNKPYQVTIKIKGSKVELTMPDQPAQNDVMNPNTSRTGGIGFGLAPGSKLIISSCKLKLLRPKT
jgi:hypothetical protein